TTTEFRSMENQVKNFSGHRRRNGLAVGLIPIFILGLWCGKQSNHHAHSDAKDTNSCDGPHAVTLDYCPFSEPLCHHPHGALILQHAQFACTLRTSYLLRCK